MTTRYLYQNLKKYSRVLLILAVILAVLMFTGCGAAPKDGEYTAAVTMEGGSGRAAIESSAKVTVEDGKAYATVIWNSPNYDYMIVDDEKYMNENTEGNSTFTIPVAEFDKDMKVIGDTTAMSVPHEVEYTLRFELAK